MSWPWSGTSMLKHCTAWTWTRVWYRPSQAFTHRLNKHSWHFTWDCSVYHSTMRLNSCLMFIRLMKSGVYTAGKTFEKNQQRRVDDICKYRSLAMHGSQKDMLHLEQECFGQLSEWLHDTRIWSVSPYCRTSCNMYLLCNISQILKHLLALPCLWYQLFFVPSPHLCLGGINGNIFLSIDNQLSVSPFNM